MAQDTERGAMLDHERLDVYTEAGAALDHLVDMGLLQTPDTVEAKRLLVRIVAMLVRLTDRTATTPDSSPPLPRPRQPRRRRR